MPVDKSKPEKTLEDVVEQLGTYPVDAFLFVQEGLGATVRRIHGESTDPEINRHISGQELSIGLRDFALQQWGMLARTVLLRWGITSTFDFGRIVFALVDNGLMQKTDRDTIEDFRNVYDFKDAFEAGYRIEAKI